MSPNDQILTLRLARVAARHRRPALATAALLLLWWTTPASASAHQALETILEAASRGARSAFPERDVRLELVAGGLDSRLRLAPCTRLESEPAQAVTAASRRVLIRVRCAQTPAWTVLVPVEIWTHGPVLVARRDLRRGGVPTADDFEVATRRVAGTPASLVSDVHALSGWQLRRPVAAGTVLEYEALERQPAIRRGQQVVLVSAPGRVEVRAPGLALGDARPGERVRVQNVNSLKIVEGRADNGDVVRIE